MRKISFCVCLLACRWRCRSFLEARKIFSARSLFAIIILISLKKIWQKCSRNLAKLRIVSDKIISLYYSFCSNSQFNQRLYPNCSNYTTGTTDIGFITMFWKNIDFVWWYIYIVLEEIHHSLFHIATWVNIVPSASICLLQCSLLRTENLVGHEGLPFVSIEKKRRPRMQ